MNLKKQIKKNYKVYPDGRVYSKFSKKFLKPETNHKGYYRVRLYLIKGSKGKRMYVHQLVALFYVRNSKKRTIINHKDSNRINNHYKNLEWVTQKQNIHHAIKYNNWLNKTGFKKKKIYCDQTQKTYSNSTEAAKALNIPFYTIIRIMKGITKNSKCGFTFKEVK